jgi:tRNA uridine 5-carboxymethylaminomethyl modification enzyme
MKNFDLIIVGGGHAGLEAAWIASRFDLKIALLTLRDVGLGSAPCNPSVGGVGKGQVVRELDALGGIMGLLADQAGIQFRTLNDSKGLAVQSTRVQIDKQKYSQAAESLVAQDGRITVIRDKLVALSKIEDKFVLVCDQLNLTARSVIMTVGTFLNGKLHTGPDQRLGGRVDAQAASGLSEILSLIKTRPARFKTGTPSRLHKDSIDYSRLVEQPSDSQTRNFHCLNHPYQRHLPQVSCFLTHTNQETMEIIRANKEKSPMYNGQINAVGARYCPSIEDKAYRYPDRNIHHVFIEPEGLDLDTVYPSGISSSLPADIQESFIHSIEGLENAKILVPGYAVEYDVVDTTQLTLGLEYKECPGLYFAGQVNGTSGYEEAAGQGWVAGANSALKLLNREPLYLSRHDSYIGVMIEDLIGNTRDEPYRLFTARSENRLYIREDNALWRMAPYRLSLNLAEKLDTYLSYFVDQSQVLSKICDEWMLTDEIYEISELSSPEGEILRRPMLLSELLKQAWLNPVTILDAVLSKKNIIFDQQIIRMVAIDKKYEGYIKRYDEQFKKLHKLEAKRINWQEIIDSTNISFECRQRISK